jgi:hypothetical protein
MCIVEVHSVKRRFFAILLILAFAAALAACKQGAAQSEDTTSPALASSPVLPSDSGAPAGWSTPGQANSPDPDPAATPELKQKIYPEPPDAGVGYSSIKVEEFLERINPALRAAGRDEMLLSEARVDENMDDDPPFDYFFIYFVRSGLEIDFTVNRETQNIEGSYIALFAENEFADYEADFYFNLFLIFFEPHEYPRILDEMDNLNGAMKTVDGENWSILRQQTLINFFPILR